MIDLQKHGQAIIKIVFMVVDFLVFNVVFITSIATIYLIFEDIWSFIPKNQVAEQFFIHLFLSLLFIAISSHYFRHYSYKKPFYFVIIEILQTNLFIALLNLAMMSFLKFYLSRYIWLFNTLFALFLIPFGRFICIKILDKIGIWQFKTIIFGTGENAKNTFLALQEDNLLGLRCIAFFDQNATDESFLGKPIIKNLTDIWNMPNFKTFQFIIATEDYNTEYINGLLIDFFKHRCRNIIISPSFSGLPLYNSNIYYLFNNEVLLIRIQNNLARRSARILKRSFDFFASLFLIIAIFPVLIIIYLLIYFDGRQPIFKHKRVGYKQKEFYCYKFRTMKINSNEILQEILRNNQNAKAEWENEFKLKDDPRVTKIGKFLRTTSLDELPQLFNALKGDMSLVGPRPVTKAEIEKYTNNADYYYMVRPGITGLWQVSGRNDVSYEKRVAFDVWYIKNWSLYIDIIVLIKTFKILLNKRGAY